MRCVTYLESHVYAYEGAHGAACLCKVKTKQLQIKDIKSELSLQLQQEIAPPFSRPIQQMFWTSLLGRTLPPFPARARDHKRESASKAIKISTRGQSTTTRGVTTTTLYKAMVNQGKCMGEVGLAASWAGACQGEKQMDITTPKCMLCPWASEFWEASRP